MVKRIRIAIVAVLSLLILCGCDDKHSQTKTETSVNVQSFLMDAAAFDLEAVVAKLKEGALGDAQALEKFINETSGINNVDLDKDGQVDELTVKEEKGPDGKTSMAVVAHPKKGEESVVAELNFERNTTTNEVVVSGAYPEYVHGYQDHYYRHTLTGSMVGDMMFYSWLFAPHPMYMPTYHYGMYYGTGGRGVMSRQQLTTSRTSYRTTTKMAPLKKQTRPASYKPTTKAAQKTASSFKKQTAARNAKLSSRSGASKSFGQRSSSTKSRGSGFSSSRSSGSRSFGSSRSFSGGSRRSSVKYKHNIHYLDGPELSSYAEQLHSMPLATWQYNDQEDDQTHLGIITEDVGAESVATSSDMEYVDLYGYTSMAVAAIQVQQNELESLRREVQVMREYVLTECR